MIELQIKDAQRELLTLAAKAIGGEDVFIVVGDKRLRLMPSDSNDVPNGHGPRPGRGSWKGRVTIPDAFYLPWSSGEMGEQAD